MRRPAAARRDEIGGGLGFGQIHTAVKKGAAAEFTGIG